MTAKTDKQDILNTPLSSHLLLSDDTLIQQHDADLIEREKALFQKYGLTRPAQLSTDTRKLIQLMAVDLNINGFKTANEVKPCGRPNKWKEIDVILLFGIRVYLMQQKHPTYSLVNIINHVAKKYYPDENPKSLYTRYHEIFNNSVNTKLITYIKQTISNKNIEELEKRLSNIQQ